MVAVCAGFAQACSFRGASNDHVANPFDPFRLYRAELCAKRKQGVKLNFSMRKKELKSSQYVMGVTFLRIPAPDATFCGEITYWIECTIYNTDVFLAQRFASAEDANVASGEFNRQMPATPELAGQQRLAKKTRAAA